jgi:hypothetical protein
VVAVTKRPGTELEELERVYAKLERRAVYRADGSFVGLRNPLRPGGIGGFCLTAVLTVVMLIWGGTPVGRYPLAERLLAYDIGICVLSLVVGLLLLLVSRWRTRLRRPAIAALHTTTATLIAAVLVVSFFSFLPLHLENWL